MISFLYRLILAWLLLPSIWTAAQAQAVTFPELNSTVPGHQDVTYFDLAKMIVPDLKSGDDGFYTGDAPIEMRHILGGDEAARRPRPSACRMRRCLRSGPVARTG